MQRGNLMEKTLKLGKIEGKRRSEWQRMRWLDSITNTMDVNVKKLQEMVKGREAWCSAVHGAAKSVTWLTDWTTATVLGQKFPLTVGWVVTSGDQVKSLLALTPLDFIHAVFAFSTQKRLFAWVHYKVTVTREKCLWEEIIAWMRLWSLMLFLRCFASLIHFRFSLVLEEPTQEHTWNM